MGRVIWFLAALALPSTNSVAAESVYLTASDRLEEYGLGEGYTFIAPYFTRVETTLWISITKAAATNSQNSNNSDNSQSQNKPATASIYYAGWEQGQAGAASGQIRYAVSCDLSKVLQEGRLDCDIRHRTRRHL